jgi:hypothetical protein
VVCVSRATFRSLSSACQRTVVKAAASPSWRLSIATGEKLA